MTTWAPRAVSHSIVGRAARMRKSSVMRGRVAVALDRDVEVGADEDPLAVERPEARLEILEGRDVRHTYFFLARLRDDIFLPAYSMKSTIRLE